VERVAAGVKERGPLDIVSRLLEQAYSRASRYGDIIGRISRYSRVEVSEEGFVEFEVEPEVYYSERGKATQRIGEYVAIVEPKSGKLVLVRVVAVERRDELAAIGIEPPLSSYEFKPEPSGLLTTTKVKAKVLLELDPEGGDEPVPATIGLEPQSPVIDPKPEVLSKLLGLRDERGPIIGSLATPSGLVKNGALTVRLPYRALLQHILITGTTGSGKTTLIKNMVASMYSDWAQSTPVVVAVDMNQDFIQLPLDPSKHPLDPVALTAHKDVKPPRALVVVTPLPLRVVESVYDGFSVDKVSVLEIARHVARMYYEESIEPLVGAKLRDLTCLARDGRSVMCKVQAPWGPLVLVPYVINTTLLDSDKVSSLMPGLTEAARALLERIRRGFRRRAKLNIYPPLQAMLGALQAYNDGVRSGDRDELFESTREIVIPRVISKGVSDESLMRSVKFEGFDMTLEDLVEECLEVLELSNPHRETYKSLYRRLLSLLDTEIVDIAVMTGWPTSRVTLMQEPRWEDIVSEAEALKAPIVLDLKWPMDKGLEGLEGPRMAAYRMLQALIEWKHMQWSRRVLGRSIVVVIDEAHQFFPQERGAKEEQEASRQVASMISRIARIGRARGVGLVFSTHSPKDLHDIIVQLANTKIILRTEPQHTERLDVPREVKEVLPRLPDRLMVVLSHIYRGGYIFVQTTTPLTAHYDISYQLFGY
jgi:DNA helicase HerA-like ATPase